MADQGDKTVREPVVSNGGVTVREGQSPVANVTLREGQAAGATVREGQPAAARPAAKKTSDFRGYAIRKQLPSNSTEADIYIVEKDGTYYVLKLYRYGIEPKNDILQKMKALSQAHPHEFIRVFEVDYDSRFKRWFEIQEYARYGTLQAFMERLANITDAQRANFVSLVAREVGEALSLLHQNELLHLDIKPSNILVRSPKWPYDLVLIDFGIATTLSADMSKKFTQTRGTPMYQSPESWVGSMGRPSDWWGLGMILLEIAAGEHPFVGLNQNVIASAIATRPVAIPDKLDAGQKELIRGLLTRDPAKRWNWEQVSRWLKCERGIPTYFEAEEPAKPEASASDVKPLVFMGQPCRSLAELAAAFAKDEESWEKGKAFLMRGYVTRWLEDINDFDASVDLGNALSGTEDTDEKTFRFVQQFGKNIPFAFGGHLITLQNLLLIVGKVLKREPVTAIEQKIADSIAGGRLLSCLEFYMKKAKTSEETETLLAALRNLKDKSAGDVVGFLDFYLHPQNYYCPFVKDASSPEKVIAASMGLNQLPRPIGYWEKLNGKYILPKEHVDSLADVKSYHAAFAQLEAMASNGLQLIPRESRSEAERKEKEALASACMDDYVTGVDKWVLGYDGDIIKALQSSLEKFRRHAASSFGFEKAQLDLWLAYLEFLERRAMPLTDEDKKLLRDVSLRKPDAVCARLQALVEGMTDEHIQQPVVRIAREEVRSAIQQYQVAVREEAEIKSGKRATSLNLTFSDKSLGSAFTAEQSNAIRVGTFYGMALGDYWTIDGVTWRIADFDYLIRLGFTI